MTKALIANHNAVVGAHDLVYHLGDMFWRTLTPLQAINIKRRLNGRHWYVLGNHEEALEAESVRVNFVSVRDRIVLQAVPGQHPTIVLDHYAGRVWNGSHRGSWQLYGHSHGKLPPVGLQMDVGVDCNNFTPVSLNQVIKLMKKVTK